MRKFFEKNKTPKTVFDFDLSDTNDPMYKKNMFLAMITSKKNVFDDEVSKKTMLKSIRYVIENCPWLNSLWDLRKNRKFLDSFLVKLLDANAMDTCVNAYCNIELNVNEPLSIEEETMPAESGGWIFNFSSVRLDPYYSMISHSCFPNIITRFVDNKSFWIVLRPIKAGGKITRSILGGDVFNEKKKKRRNYIKEVTGKKCACEGCLENWPLLFKMPKFSDQCTIAPMYEMIYEVSNDILFIKNQHKSDYAKYTMLINSMEDNFPCLESALCQVRLLFTSHILALPAPWYNQRMISVHSEVKSLLRTGVY